MSSEELRRNVFSSIHMSSLVRTTQTSITYPSCSFCGGSAINSKSSPKRKVALCQVSLYTNLSDSFIVWYKKQDEPKGMLWLHSCCVRKGQENSIELISRGCRGRCSYTLKFASLSANEEWYRLLKQESRKVPALGDDFTNDMTDGSNSDLTSLDSMLTEITPLSSISELSNYSESDENSDDSSSVLSSRQSPTIPTTKSKKKIRSNSQPLKVKVKPVFCNPLQGLGRNRKSTQPTISCSVSVSTVTAPLESIENTSRSSPDLDHWARWSWPLKA